MTESTFRFEFSKLPFGLRGIAYFMCALSLGVFGISFDPDALMLAAAIVLGILVLQARMRLELGPKELTYRGLFKKTTVPYDEVESFRCCSDLGYPQDRLGPLCYQIRYRNKTLIINTLLYPHSALSLLRKNLGVELD